MSGETQYSGIRQDRKSLSRRKRRGEKEVDEGME